MGNSLSRLEEDIICAISQTSKIDYDTLQRCLMKKHKSLLKREFEYSVNNLVRENYVEKTCVRDALGKVSCIDFSLTPFYDLLRAAKN
jgi:hypothetical protein